MESRIINKIRFSVKETNVIPIISAVVFSVLIIIILLQKYIENQRLDINDINSFGLLLSLILLAGNQWTRIDPYRQILFQNKLNVFITLDEQAVKVLKSYIAYVDHSTEKNKKKFLVALEDYTNIHSKYSLVLPQDIVSEVFDFSESMKLFYDKKPKLRIPQKIEEQEYFYDMLNEPWHKLSSTLKSDLGIDELNEGSRYIIKTY